MVLTCAFAQMARKRLEEEFTLQVFVVLKDAGVVSLIDFAYGFSSETDLTNFLLCKGVVAGQEVGPWWRWARLVARNQSRVQSESLVALVRRAASWRPVATDGLRPGPCFHETLPSNECLSWVSGATATQATDHRGCSRPTSIRNDPSPSHRRHDHAIVLGHGGSRHQVAPGRRDR